MGNLFVVGNLVYPDPEKITLDQWFDYRPIPEITGENSTDPKLLGIDDYLPDE